MPVNFFRVLVSLMLVSPFMISCGEDTGGEAEEAAAQQAPPAGPRSQPGTEMGIYTPEQHELYSGRFTISAGRIYQVGRLDDPPGWDHIDNEAQRVNPVEGVVDLDVDEIQNTGTFIARLQVPEGDLVLEMDRFHEFSPCQDGGVAAYIFEHGDSGCGDSNWPKSFLYVAGWGYGHATLNGEELYQDYQMHFMLTQGMRDRDTLRVSYPLLNKRSPAGAVDPAAQQLDFFIRSPDLDEQNNPNRKIFDHFFAMEVTWK